MIVAIHQPNYIPWLGYFYKIYKSDIFVFLDDVQYSNKGSHNYNYIKTTNGIHRLKIPVQQHFGQYINEITTKDFLVWKTDHLKLIHDNYSKACFFEEIYSDFESLLTPSYKNLSHMNIEIIKFFCKKLGIERKFITASELNLSFSKEEKVIQIVHSLGGSVYYSGSGAKSYQDPQNFNKMNIKLEYSNFSPFVYPQFNGEYCANISIIDYLMHCGYDWDRVLQAQNVKNEK